MTSDEALMLEFQGGSRAAFEELFARYREPLYGFFGRRLNNPERAEDLAQETFRWALRSSSDVLRSTDRQILLGGADLPDSPVTLNPQFQGAPEPITEFVIPVGKWSDGTAAPAM